MQKKKKNIFILLLMLSFFGMKAFCVQAFPQEPIITIPPDSIVNDSTTVDSLIEYEIVYEYDTVFEYDTVIQYDTIIDVDTIFKPVDVVLTDTSNSFNNTLIDAPEIPLPIKYQRYRSAGIHYSFNDFNFGYQNPNEPYLEHYNLRKNNEKPKASYSVGGDFRYSSGRLNINLGLDFTEIKNKYNYPYQTSILDSTISWDVTSLSFWQNDTIDSYYQVIGIDTTWYHVIREVWVTEYDSTRIVDIDTAFNNNVLEGIQKLQFLEIPILVGYQIVQKRKIEIDLQSGIITSILIYRKGKVIRADNNSFVELENYPLVKSLFSFYGGVNLRYRFTQKLSAEISPFYRMSLNSFLENKKYFFQPVEMKGVRLSVRYRW